CPDVKLSSDNSLIHCSNWCVDSGKSYLLQFWFALPVPNRPLVPAFHRQIEILKNSVQPSSGHARAKHVSANEWQYRKLLHQPDPSSTPQGKSERRRLCGQNQILSWASRSA